MSSKSSSVPIVCWRRLYTDACLLRSLADVSSDSPSQSIVLESIARLDRAIIISGAPGEGRLDLILHVIQKIQTDYLDPLPCDLVHRFFSPPRRPSDLATSSKQVPIIAPPSFSAFQNQLCQHPFILQGFAHNWPAMAEHPWSSIDYLRSVAGPGRLVPIEVGKDYRKDDWTQQLMNWDEFLDALDFSDRAHSPIEAGQSPQEAEIFYLAQHNLLMQFPALRSDIIVPDYVYASLSPPGYEPPGNEEQLVLNAWLGPKGTISPAHTVRRLRVILFRSTLISCTVRIPIIISMVKSNVGNTFSVALTRIGLQFKLLAVKQYGWLLPMYHHQCIRTLRLRLIHLLILPPIQLTHL